MARFSRSTKTARLRSRSALLMDKMSSSPRCSRVAPHTRRAAGPSGDRPHVIGAGPRPSCDDTSDRTKFATAGIYRFSPRLPRLGPSQAGGRLRTGPRGVGSAEVRPAQLTGSTRLASIGWIAPRSVYGPGLLDTL